MPDPIAQGRAAWIRPVTVVLLIALLWLALGLLLGWASDLPVPLDYHDPIPWPPPGCA